MVVGYLNIAIAWEKGFRVQGSGFRVRVSGFRVRGSGFRVQGPLVQMQCDGRP
jgi:hypothetical protein